MCFRLAAPESVQFFQFDKDGNMYVFPPGSGCAGVPKLVHPGDEFTFSGIQEESKVANSAVNVCNATTHSSQISDVTEIFSSTGSSFKVPLKQDVLEDLSHKNFSPETMKKVAWADKLYREWRNYRNEMPNLESILCDLNDKTSITKSALIFALTRFLSEIKKVDGGEYPGKTLYDILICLQFHLETIGLGWKLLNDKTFKDVKFTLDNLMKL